MLSSANFGMLSGGSRGGLSFRYGVDVPVTRVGGIDDPVWQAGTPSPAAPRQPDPTAALGVVAGGSLLLVAALVWMPWFGLDQNSAWWDLWPTWTAVADIPASFASSAFSPGTQGFGVGLVWLAVATAVSAGVTVPLLRLCFRGRKGLAVVELSLVAALACAVLVQVIREMAATPPYGEGPDLTYDWGAVVGVSAASLAVLASAVALLIGLRQGGDPEAA